MKNGNNQKKRFWLIFGLILLLAIIIYMNRAFSHIYSTIGDGNLEGVNGAASYVIDAAGSAAAEKEGKDLIYVALGDSLTAGVGTDGYEDSFPYLLAQDFSGGERRVVLHSLAYPGMKSEELLETLVPAAIAAQPDIITLLIGVNDIHNWSSAEEFRQTYGEILRRLSTETDAEVYAINLPFIGANEMMLPPYQSWFDYRTREFNQVIEELAAQYGVHYLDLYTPTVSLFKTAGEHYAKDLFHPSAAGYKIWADLLYDHIDR